jgi:hypothetical protein
VYDLPLYLKIKFQTYLPHDSDSLLDKDNIQPCCIATTTSRQTRRQDRPSRACPHKIATECQPYLERPYGRWYTRPIRPCLPYTPYLQDSERWGGDSIAQLLVLSLEILDVKACSSCISQNKMPDCSFEDIKSKQLESAFYG